MISTVVVTSLLAAGSDLSLLDREPDNEVELPEGGGVIAYGPFDRMGPKDSMGVLTRLLPDGTKDPLQHLPCQQWELPESSALRVSVAPDVGIFIFGDLDNCSGLRGSTPGSPHSGVAWLTPSGQYLRSVSTFCSEVKFQAAAPFRDGVLLGGDLTACVPSREELKKETPVAAWFEKNVLPLDLAGQVRTGELKAYGAGFGPILSLVPSPDGALWVGMEGSAQGPITRLTRDGGVDAKFAAEATKSLEGQSQCRLALDGTSALITVCRHPRKGTRVSRLGVDGRLDENFSANAAKLRFEGAIHAFGVQPDGKVVLGGDFKRQPEFKTTGLVRLDKNGNVDDAFATSVQGALGPKETIHGLVVQRDGRIVLGGEFRGFKQSRALNLVRLMLDGSVDVDFSRALLNGFSKPVRSLALQQDGRIFVAGHYGLNQTLPLKGVVKLNGGAVDLDFSRNATDAITKALGAQARPYLFNVDVSSAGTVTVRMFPPECLEECADERVCGHFTVLELDSRGKLVTRRREERGVDCNP